MKFSLLLFVLTFIVFTPKAHALLGRTNAERQRRVETEQSLVQQQHLLVQQQTTNGKQAQVIHVLSAGVVMALVIGAAVGSKTRRDVAGHGHSSEH